MKSRNSFGRVDFDRPVSLDDLMASMIATGFQATNVGLAVEQINQMVVFGEDLIMTLFKRCVNSCSGDLVTDHLPKMRTKTTEMRQCAAILSAKSF